MEILIRNDREPSEIDEEKLMARARKVLGALGCDAAELSVWLCGDEDIRQLHRQYFGEDSPTNVISFAQREGPFVELDPELLGDVVISLDTARRDAEEAGAPLDDEIAFLLIHGVLHLLGYDHEGDRSVDAPAMEAKESELFRLVHEA